MSSKEAAISVDDPGLAAHLRAGDREAIGAVVSAYLGQVLRAARGAGLDPHAAEDVTQATFVTFIERAPSFEGRSHVRTWLFGILYRKVAEARRAGGREQQVDDLEDVIEWRFDAKGSWIHPPRPADEQLHGSEVAHHIGECLEGVPTKQRIAFVLRETEGLGTDELCKILDVSRTNLGVLLHRARNRLRECLEAKGVEGPT